MTTTPPKPRMSYDATGRYIYEFFTKRGANPAGTCALIGNWVQESSLDPFEIEAVYHNGYGLAQWSFDRRKAFLQAASNRNVAWQDIDFQLNYALKELQGSYPSAWRIMTTTANVKKATEDINTIYEGSPDSPALIYSGRVVPALEWYAKMAPTSPGYKAPYPGKPMDVGAHGAPVSELQRGLTRRGFPVKVTGVFDQPTAHAVMALKHQWPYLLKTEPGSMVGPKTYVTATK